MAGDGWATVLVSESGEDVETTAEASRIGEQAGTGLRVGDRLRKHVKAVLAALGVPSRAAAAVAVMRAR